MRFLLLAVMAVAVWAHAPITPAMRGPLRVEGARVLDAAGVVGQMRGAVLADVDSATVATLGVMRLRWNFNTVRIPVRAADLGRVAAVVERAGAADLVVVLASIETSTAFWGALAGALREAPNVVFSVGSAEMLGVIRGAGARQIVAVPLSGGLVAGENVIYEGAGPFAGFAGRVPVYAGEWGAAGLAGSDAVFQAMYDFDVAGVHWTALGFGAGGLVRDTVDYAGTAVGETILSWMTGDPIGFGYLRKEAIASAAGGPASPAAPGALLSLYIEQMGPSPDLFGRLGADGRLPLELGGTEVFFDGVRVPVLFAGQYQVNVQVPYTVVPGRAALVQVFYRGVPSNRLLLDVVPAAGELFHDVFTRGVVALNEDGSRNGEGRPAGAGSSVVLFGTGLGMVAPLGVAGLPAVSPHPVVALPVSVFVDGVEGEVLFAGEVPGFVGLAQINVRLGRVLRVGSVPVVLRVGGRDSQAAVVVWVR